MTEFEPLKYAASVVVFALVLTYAGVVGFRPVLREKIVEGGWVLSMVGLRTLGLLIGLAAWMIGQSMWAPHIMTLLWSDRAAVATDALRCSLLRYCDRRAFYRPGHAA